MDAFINKIVITGLVVCSVSFLFCATIKNVEITYIDSKPDQSDTKVKREYQLFDSTGKITQKKVVDLINTLTELIEYIQEYKYKNELLDEIIRFDESKNIDFIYRYSYSKQGLIKQRETVQDGNVIRKWTYYYNNTFQTNKVEIFSFGKLSMIEYYFYKGPLLESFISYDGNGNVVDYFTNYYQEGGLVRKVKKGTASDQQEDLYRYDHSKNLIETISIDKNSKRTLTRFVNYYDKDLLTKTEMYFGQSNLRTIDIYSYYPSGEIKECVRYSPFFKVTNQILKYKYEYFK